MVVWEILTGTVTAPGSTLTQLSTANTNDSFTLRNGINPRLIQIWARNNAAGVLQIKAPQFADNVQGLRFPIQSGTNWAFLGREFWEQMFPQEALTVNLSGSATAGQIETASLYVVYDDVGGLSGARFISPDEEKARLQHYFVQEVDLTPGTGGGYSGAKAINSTYDLMQANKDYAFHGYLLSADCATVGLKGADTANIRCGGPGLSGQKQLTSRWFEELSRVWGINAIPVVNSANKSSTFVDVAQDQGGAAVNVHLLGAQLS
jgi:hypothetical protein